MTLAIFGCRVYPVRLGHRARIRICNLQSLAVFLLRVSGICRYAHGNSTGLL